MKILIIEDQIKVCELLKNFLTDNGFVCEYALTAAEGLNFLNNAQFDIVLLDINLPDESGLELIQKIRAGSINKKIGIIMVSALKKTSVAINLGADDYITKPIDSDVLLARINGLLRRITDIPSTIVTINNIRLDTVENLVFVNDTKVKLVNKEFQILRYLMLAHPKVVTSEELMEHIYEDSIDPYSSVLRVHISRLRVKLSKANDGRDLIYNRKNMGYHL